MEYQKIINLLDNTPNQPTKFRTKQWVEINDKLRGTYNTNSQIRFKTSILRSSLCDYSDAYILVKGTIRTKGTIPMYNLIEYSDNYSKTSGIFFQCCEDVPALDNDGSAIDFAEANVIDSFNLKVKLTG